MDSPSREEPRPSRFRRDLWIAMMVVIGVLTAAGILLAERNLSAEVDRDLHQRFEVGLAGLHRAQQVREASITGLARNLAKKPRIHAAVEDDALDLLYPSARDELRAVLGSIVTPRESRTPPDSQPSLKAAFCRFLGHDGAVIVPPRDAEVGDLTPEEEGRLSLARIPAEEQSGFLVRPLTDGTTVADQFLTVPIVSSDTHEYIAALVVGFLFDGLGGGGKGSDELQTGVWQGGYLHFPSMPEAARASLAPELARALGGGVRSGRRLEVEIGGQRHLVLSELLNPVSLYPPAYGVCAFSLAGFEADRRRVIWRFSLAGGVMLAIGIGASRYLARRFSKPVEALAVESVENLRQRQRVEAVLETTSAELVRSVRFSADASHQLNTPVTVLRAGLEDLLARPELSAEVREDISQLVHQTYRLGGVIQDLLLLSRMDAGRLKLDLKPVSLGPLIDGWLDDFTALPDAFGLTVEAEIPDTVQVAGDIRYLPLIVQNLLENARKYNRAGGRVRLHAIEEGGRVALRVGNTGLAIPAGLQATIFDRFDRGGVAENIPGCGLGLNLSRELALLHGGDLKLLGSGNDWTEFEVSFQIAPSTGTGAHRGK